MKITKNQIAVLLFTSLLIPAIASADQCTEFMANLIQAGTDRAKAPMQSTDDSNPFFEKTIPQLTEILGQPQVSNRDDGYTEYKWVCQSDGKSTLGVYSKDGNRIVSYGVMDDKGSMYSSAKAE